MIAKNKLKFLENKKIAFIGLGVENFSLLKFLIKKRVAGNFAVCDPKNEKELGIRWEELKILAKKNGFVVCHSDPESSGEESILHKAKLLTNNSIIENRGCRTQDGHRSLAIARDDKRKKIILISGNNYDNDLKDFDIVFRSPGYPLFSKNLIKAKKAGVIISSPMKLFFDLCSTKNIIGVTGSKGKGTTASLIYEVLKTARKKVFLGGNIGIAPFDFIDKIKQGDFVVLELSSFQLEDLDKSPRLAVITNLFREHLASADPANPNYHKSMKAYWKAKANIFKHQKKNDYLVVNEALKNCVMPAKAGIQKKMINASKLDSGSCGRNDRMGKIIFYDKSALPSNLIGEHNQENIAAAEAVAKILKIKPEIAARAVKKFKGLPHRTELVTEINGVKYFDDSFATVPEVSAIALKSFSGEKNIILLAGGADKGSDFSQFAKEIKKRVKYLILFKGKGSDKIKKQISNFKFQISNSIVESMPEAIKIAKSKAKPGDIILLSAGCASFGCFKNYKDRGEQFKKEVLKK